MEVKVEDVKRDVIVNYIDHLRKTTLTNFLKASGFKGILRLPLIKTNTEIAKDIYAKILNGSKFSITKKESKGSLDCIIHSEEKDNKLVRTFMVNGKAIDFKDIENILIEV